MPGGQILIVENDPIIGRMLEMQVKSLGYSVTGVVGNGADALVYATSRRPDLVVIDTSVSDPIDGIDTARYLTRMFTIPVVFLSGTTSPPEIERAKQANPLGYLVKPIGRDQLFSTIEIGLNLSKARKKPREENPVRNSIAGLLEGDDGIICLDTSEGVLLMNSVAEFITGTPTRSVFLSPVRDILHFPDEIASSLFADSLIQAYRGAPSIGKMKNFLVRSKDGSTKSASPNIIPVRNTDNEIIGIVIQLVFTHSSTMRSLSQKHAAA